MQQNIGLVSIFNKQQGCWESVKQEEGLVKRPIEIEQSSSHRNEGLIRISLMVK